jgi:hypothetical protein
MTVVRCDRTVCRHYLDGICDRANITIEFVNDGKHKHMVCKTNEMNFRADKHIRTRKDRFD